MSTARVRALLLAAALATSAVSCSSSDSDGGSASKETTTVTATTAPSDELTVLVSNDDGYQAEGIDTLVETLRKVDGVKVVVVAPKDQQSSTGGKTTPGDLEVTDVELASGYAAKAVDGYPSDAVRVALEDLGVKPDVVITGINEGQNLGPAVDLSGTVGAARMAVAHDIPALATSQGVGSPFDYESAVPFILDWLEEHRAALEAGDAPVQVDNLNVPTCATGEVRGLAEVDSQLGGDVMESLQAGDCTSTTPVADLADDVEAFQNGYATLDTVPSEPG